MATKTAVRIDAGQISQLELDAVSETVERLPANSSMRAFLQTVLDAGRRGAGVTALAQDEDLSPNKAAKVLGMSRPHLLKFIRSGALECRHVGTHQLISYEDLMDFKDRYENASKDVAKALATDPHASRQITLTDEDMAELDAL